MHGKLVYFDIVKILTWSITNAHTTRNLDTEDYNMPNIATILKE